jgi:hypothetical protein
LFPPYLQCKPEYATQLTEPLFPHLPNGA